MNLNSVYDPFETFNLLGIDPSRYSRERTLEPVIRKDYSYETDPGRGWRHRSRRRAGWELARSRARVVVIGRTKPADESRIENLYGLDATAVDWPSHYSAIEKETGAPMDAVISLRGRGVFGKTNLIPVERARQVFELNFWACTSAARAAADYWTDRGRAGKFVAILNHRRPPGCSLRVLLFS